MTNKATNKEKKVINTQQVAVSRESMRKVKLFAASNYMPINKVITLAIDNFCDGVSIEMTPHEAGNNNNTGVGQ